MSLQVWLPLNGNLNNQGLSEVTVTNNGATVDSNGKIGSCYSFDGGADRVSISDPLPFTEDLTIAAWIKPTNVSSTTTQYALSYNTDAGGTSGHLLGIGMYGSSALAVWCSGTVFTTSVTLVDNTWYHVAASRARTGELKVYVNGSCILTSADSNAPASRWFTIGGRSNSATGGAGGVAYCFKGSINDVRLYDHCLSAKEVKEISKGLVCHYKLDNNGFGGENLILESHRVTSGSDASGITSTYMDDGSLKIVSTSGNNHWRSCGFSKDSNSNVGSKLSVGDTYTISLDVKVEEGSSLPTLFINGGNGYKALHPVNGKFVTNNWFRAYYTSTWGEPGTSYGNISLHLGFSSAIGTFYFKNFKLEKGSKPTQWCPSPLDDNTLGLDSTMESDCSGLSNNGTKIGGLSSSTNPLSIRYESCYDFDGNTGCIQIPNLATLAPSGEFTMNCWIYHDNTWSSKGYETIFGGPSGFELDAKHSGTKSPVLYACDWGKGRATYELNKWNMITMTRNASETKFYINGELRITGSAGTIPSGNYFVGAWQTSNGQNYKGKISDFRLYSTVLSVEDIKELYSTSASIDKNGNMYAYEFKEE